MKNQEIAEIEVSYSAKVPIKNRTKIVSSRGCYEVFLNHWNKDTINLFEEFKILFLNRGNRCIGIYTVSKGGTTGTIVDAKLIFSVALKCNAISIVLGHNHPSGNIYPSKADIDLTKKIKEGGKLLDIAVLDHLIVTEEGYYSFADEGRV